MWFAATLNAPQISQSQMCFLRKRKKKKNLKHFWRSPCDLFQPAVLFKPFYFVVAQLGFDPKRTAFLKVQILCSGGKGGFPKGSRRDDKGKKWKDLAWEKRKYLKASEEQTSHKRKDKHKWL